MKQRKRYGRRTHLLLSAALLVLCVLLCLPACSDMILNRTQHQPSRNHDVGQWYRCHGSDRHRQYCR